MSDPRTALVGAGYDAMADTWESWSAHVGNDPRHEWLARLVALVPAGGHVVELGCGNGTLETRELAARFRLTGVDLSAEQLRRARERVPGAAFVEGDLTTVEFEAGSLAAVCSFYVFNHCRIKGFYLGLKISQGYPYIISGCIISIYSPDMMQVNTADEELKATVRISFCRLLFRSG